MSFEISKNGYVMYKPTWQQEPGSRMRAMNRSAAESYYANFSSLGNNLLGGVTNATAGSVELTMQIATQRVQSEYNTKLNAAYSGLDISI